MPAYWICCGLTIALGLGIYVYGTRDQKPKVKRPQHARPARFSALLQGAFSLLAVAALVTVAGSGVRISTANAAVTRTSAVPEPAGGRILDRAETKTGDWYSYGAAGPSYFDCSGLVYWAAHQLGVNLPRTTQQMLSSPLLYRVWAPQRGDLAFYGTGHVEMVTRWWHATFGAQQSGTRVGWHTWGAYWHPTEFRRFR